ncbi:hypothetical protein ABEB36_000053 [Hypothenemus hampei]|uniref:Uncharacterized protein n=1 Tax=Hypothenemus hampei TaxID=57062 RepID=A0ABD1FA33_HYPHA
MYSHFDNIILILRQSIPNSKFKTASCASTAISGGVQLSESSSILNCIFLFNNNTNADRLLNSANIELKKRRLLIKNASSLDNGVYRCEAKNAAGTKKSHKNFPLRVQGTNSPLIQTIPTDLVIKLGSTGYFDCSYQNAEVLEWYFKESGPLKNNSRLTLHSNGTLQITNVTYADEGWYNCVGFKSNSTEIPQSYTADLHLAFLEPFSQSSFEPVIENDTKVVGEGFTFQITCLEPKGLPLVKKWWQNPAGHTISDRGEVYVDDGRMIMETIKSNHAGTYKCVAENLAGITEKTLKIIVTNKPQILQDPASLTVDEGEKSVLECVYNASQEQYTQVKWRKDGKNLRVAHDSDENSSAHQRIRAYKHNGTLVIHSTQTTDRGEYICLVITEGFEPVFSQPATISVIEQLRFAPPPVNKKLELDSVAKIHCKAQGTPPPIVRWEKDGIPFENLPSHVTDTNGTLHFNRVTANDKGKYNCIASNSQGAINVSINIEVVVAPRFLIPPKNPVNINAGDSATIDCVVEGDPEPTIQWDKDLKMNDFDSSRFTVLPNGSLHITEVYYEDQNKYGCTAGNSAGLNRKEVQLIVHSHDQGGDATVTKAFLITMSVAGAYIILVVGLMVWCKYVRRSRKLPLTDDKLENGDGDEGQQQELKVAENGTGCGPSKVNGVRESHKDGQRSDGGDTCNSQMSNQSKKSKSCYDRLSISRSILKDVTLIGRGEFGDIMLAKISEADLPMKPSSPEEVITSELPVLVKVLTQTKDDNCLAEFKREIDMFSKINHEQITKLYGLCREQEPHYLILEHTEWGDLKKFLLATKTGAPPPLTVIQRVGVVHQISRAMDHLATQRIVHKDLAARNCLVTSNLKIKVGLARMTKEPYSQEYCKHANQVIPLRWLPQEAVYEDDYSTKSDVYAFGVLIWEVFSQGELPHSRINDNTFLGKLREKKLDWKCHSETPESLKKWQEACWDPMPQKRPSFAQLSNEVGEILKTL